MTQKEKQERLAYSVSELASMLGVSNQHIFNMINQGEIKKFKLGRRTLISIKEYERITQDLEE